MLSENYILVPLSVGRGRVLQQASK